MKKPEQLLHDIKAAYTAGASLMQLTRDMHQLAEMHFKPAIGFFTSLLDHPDWSWRVEAIRLLAFHFEPDPAGELVDRLRHLLASDPEAQVRLSASSALASQSAWPEQSLIKAMRGDPDQHVRRSAFASLLIQAGIPPFKVQDVERDLREGRIKPTLECLESIFRKEGLDLQMPKS